MKSVFSSATIEVIRLDAADIIATSTDENGIEIKDHVVAD